MLKGLKEINNVIPLNYVIEPLSDPDLELINTWKMKFHKFSNQWIILYVAMNYGSYDMVI